MTTGEIVVFTLEDLQKNGVWTQFLSNKNWRDW